MINHYDTLNLASTATQEEIKVAYRRAAQQAHPDKGGSVDDMAAVNKAYEVLSDPERRAKYDATGQDSDANSDHQRAQMALAQILTAAIAAGARDPVRHARSILDNQHKEASLHKVRVEKELQKIRGVEGKVRAKEGENMFDALVRNLLDRQAEAAGQIDEAFQHIARVQALLDNYEFTGEVAPEATAATWASHFVTLGETR